jgi:choline-sulfatase
LRADRVGRGLTPNLDRLAARGVQFANARSVVPLTLPSHVSIMTGALPPQHGVRENGRHVFGGTPAPVATVLKEAGYRTAAFIGAYVLDRRFGLAAGFETYDDQIARGSDGVERLEAERPGNEVVDRAIQWLTPRSGTNRESAPDPFFLWVHLYDPHSPYTPPAQFLQQAAGHAYDGEVAFADAQVGRLLAVIDRLRLRDRSIVMVAGDHGESLSDHGERTHGMLVYDAAVRVPLILTGPGIAPTRRTDPVSLIDIIPTILGSVGVADANRAGRNLLDGGDSEREIYVETEYPRAAGWSPVYALVQDRWKAIVSRGTELYDLTADPSERSNVATARASLAAAMAGRIETLRRPQREAAPATMSPEAGERLRALGYVASTTAPAQAGAGPNPADQIAAWAEFEDALSELSAGQASHAVPRLKALALAQPDAPVFLSTYARALAKTGATRAALDVYRRAVARWANDPILFHELAVAARDAGAAAEAMKAERAALALDGAMPSAHNGAGLLLTDAGRHREAADEFARATDHDPTNASYWVNLGNARRATGERDAAADAYRRAGSLDPRSADAANGLGVLLVQQRRAADAIPYFERALQSAPDLIEARLNLGIAYQESGQRDRALATYRDVLSRARPGSPERRAAADLLRSGAQ